MSMDSPISAKNRAAIPLSFLFLLTSASALFFAFLPSAPWGTIAVTLLLAPVWIRTEYLSQCWQRRHGKCTWAQQFRLALDSFAWVLLTGLVSSLAFVLVSLMFGLMAIVLGIATGMADLSWEVAIIGTAGGTIWGIAAGLIMVAWRVHQSWNGVEDLTLPSS